MVDILEEVIQDLKIFLPEAKYRYKEVDDKELFDLTILDIKSHKGKIYILTNDNKIYTFILYRVPGGYDVLCPRRVYKTKRAVEREQRAVKTAKEMFENEIK